MTIGAPVIRQSTARSALAWAGDNLFGSIPNTIVTLVLFVGAGYLAVSFVEWAFVTSSSFTGTAADCRARSGACWAVFASNWRLFLFGTYPPAAHWRGSLALLVMACSLGLYFWPRCRRADVGVPLYAISAVLLLVLLRGSEWVGLSVIDLDLVGGLLLSTTISWLALPSALPLATLLALGRRSDYPALRALATMYIEVVRALPMLVVLFLAVVVFPLFLFGGAVVGKFVSSVVGVMLFAAAYQAEVIRGGLQSVDEGVREAAASLALGYWATHITVILPLAFSVIVRPLAGIFVLFVKDTSLVSVIGLFELTGITSIIVSKSEWISTAMQTYAIIGLVYVLLCWTISRLSRLIETNATAYLKRDTMN